jgi:membrane protease YdiL (CAAX protease family)
MASSVLIGFVMGFVATITHYISPRHITAREIGFFQVLLTLSILAGSATYLFFARGELKETLRRFLSDLTDGLRRPVSLLILPCVPLGVFGTIHWAMITPQMTKNFLHDMPPTYWLAIALPAVVVVPVAEEVFYRGFVWDRLSSAMPPWKASTITAALFISAHIVNGILAPFSCYP